MASSYKITRMIDGILVSGALSVAALEGQFVSVKNPASAAGQISLHDSAGFDLATGRKGFCLMRDVLNLTEIPLATLTFGNEKVTPVLVNEQVSAREIQEGEFEGTDYLDASIVAGLAMGSELTTKSGKIALRDFAAQSIQLAGRNGAGAWTVNGVKAGDKITGVFNLTDNADVTSAFTLTAPADNTITQTGATDYTTKQLLVTLQMLEQTVFRLIGYLEPEDSGNPVRIAIEAV